MRALNTEFSGNLHDKKCDKQKNEIIIFVAKYQKQTKVNLLKTSCAKEQKAQKCLIRNVGCKYRREDLKECLSKS